MEYDNINCGVEEFGLPCPPWDQDDYAAAAFAFDDHHSIIDINLQPDTFFGGLDDDDDDIICSEELIKQSNKPSCITRHGRGKELRTAIRVLKPTADQLAAAYRLLRNKKKNKDTTATAKTTTSSSSSMNVDDPPKKAILMNQKATATKTNTSINVDDQPKNVLVAARVMKTAIQKDGPKKYLLMHKQAAVIKKSSTTTSTTHEDKPTTKLALESKKEIVSAKIINNNDDNNNNNNNNIGPKDVDQKVEVVLPIWDEDSSMQLKFESAKRKLHDSYERINIAKKLKSIQVIDFQKPPLPLPKPKARTSYCAKFPRNKFHQPAAILQH